MKTKLSNDMITKDEALNTIAVKHGYKNWEKLTLNATMQFQLKYLLEAMDYLIELSNSHKHSVSGKRPDLKHILIAYGCKHIGLNQAYEEILAACASGAVDKTVREGVNGGEIGGLDAYQNILEP